MPRKNQGRKKTVNRRMKMKNSKNSRKKSRRKSKKMRGGMTWEEKIRKAMSEGISKYQEEPALDEEKKIKVRNFINGNYLDIITNIEETKNEILASNNYNNISFKDIFNNIYDDAANYSDDQISSGLKRSNYETKINSVITNVNKSLERLFKLIPNK